MDVLLGTVLAVIVVLNLGVLGALVKRRRRGITPHFARIAGIIGMASGVIIVILVTVGRA